MLKQAVWLKGTRVLARLSLVYLQNNSTIQLAYDEIANWSNNNNNNNNNNNMLVNTVVTCSTLHIHLHDIPH